MSKEITKTQSLLSLISKKEGDLIRAIPSHLNSKALIRSIQTEVSSNEKLSACDPVSVLKCIFQCSQLGLIPGPLGHVYLIPYKTKCTMQIGYKGMIDMAMRSGNIESIHAECIHRNDSYVIQYGLERKCLHTPELFEERGDIVGTYAVATFKGGNRQFVYLSTKEINKIRDKSQSYIMAKTYKSNSIWDSHYDEMCKKTAIRRLFKYLPISTEMTHAVNLDERSEYDPTSQEKYIDSNVDVRVEREERSTSEELKEALK